MEQQNDNDLFGPRAVGRYLVLHPIGAGAMGTVYAAYDPQLDRRVALKLLHAQSDGKLRTRLLAEAQAMARLSHPNVVAVHDAGTLEDRVFLAMDLVEGKTLGAWLKSEPHSWREIVRVFILAGRGLAAAHAAGIVHRDFKPENVLVGDDGRVRVTDFGLARAERRAVETPERNAELNAPLKPVTQAGALLGSPPYMSPEQIRGEAVDASADQFSFSVALYAALYGERPYAGETLNELLQQIEQGKVRPEPRAERGRGVPGWIRKVLLRGISPRATDRYPSLNAMLAALENDPAVRSRRLGAGLLVLALIAGALFIVHRQSAREAEVCRGAERKLQGVWDDSLRARGKTAFAATQISYASATWTRVEETLDRYAGGWIAMRTEACEATAVRKQQPADLLDLRMACLDDRLRALKAVSSLVASAEKPMIKLATQMASGLPSLSGCANEAALRAPEAATPAQLPQVNAIRDELAQATASGDAGKPPVAKAEELAAAAKKLGYAPLEAQTLVALGRLQRQAGDVKTSQKTFVDATAVALRAKVDGPLVEAWTELLDVDLELQDVPAATAAAQQARAAVSRVPDEPRLQAQLLLTLSYLDRFQQGNVDESLHDCEKAIAILEHDKNPADLGVQILALAEIGFAYASTANWLPATDAFQRSWEKASAHYGPEHPITGEMEGGLGAMLSQQERFDEGRPHLQHSVEILERALGPDHPALSDALRDLGSSYIHDDPARALSLFDRAMAINTARLGDETNAILHYMRGLALEQLGQHEPARKELERSAEINLAVSHNPADIDRQAVLIQVAAVLIEEGKLKAAEPILAESHATLLKTLGPDNPQTGDSLHQLARLELLQKHLPEARRDAEESIRVAHKNIAGDSGDSIQRELLLARIALAEGKGETARASLERLVALPGPGLKSAVFNRPLALFLLAQVLWTDRSSRPRALELADEAQKEFAALKVPAPKERAELERWLAGHQTSVGK